MDEHNMLPKAISSGYSYFITMATKFYPPPHIEDRMQGLVCVTQVLYKLSYILSSIYIFKTRVKFVSVDLEKNP